MEIPAIETMIVELLNAGWQRISFTCWRRPDGEWFYGPYRAWCVMKGIPCYPVGEIKNFEK